jgi:hypothetical protein
MWSRTDVGNSYLPGPVWVKIRQKSAGSAPASEPSCQGRIINDALYLVK